MATVVASGADRKASERRFLFAHGAVPTVPCAPRVRPELLPEGRRPILSAAQSDAAALVILHGTVFSIWMLLIVAQTQLIGARKHAIHMQLGKLGMLFAILMIPVMYLTAVWQVARANQAPFTDPLTWTIVPLSVIVPFAILVWNGWENRRDVQTHKRLMLSAGILVMMGPAIGRLPIAPPTRVGMSILLLLGLLLFIPLLLWDRRTVGHTHPATKLGLAMASITIAVPLAVFWLNLPWAKVAAHLPGVGS